MQFSFSLISGISIGIEHVSPIPEEGLFNSCIVIDLAFIRCIIEIGDFSEEE